MLRGIGTELPRHRMRLLLGAVLVLVGLASGPGKAGTAEAGNVAAMRGDAWLETLSDRIESEAELAVRTFPAIPAALVREWRSFDRHGSAVAASADLGWIVLVAIIALCGEKLAANAPRRRPRRRLRTTGGTPSLSGLFGLLGCDLLGLAVFIGLLAFCQRHFLTETGISAGLAIVAANVLIRWRIAALVVGVVLRPNEPLARLVDLDDGAARRLARFLSGVILAIVVTIAISRYGTITGLAGEADQVICLLTGLMTAVLSIWAVIRARAAVEGLIRGRPGDGVVAAVRAALARAWLFVALGVVVALEILFVFGLSLGMLGYFHALNASLGVWLVVLVLERLLGRAWSGDAADAVGGSVGAEHAVTRTFHRILRAILLLIATVAFVRIWVGALDMSPAAAGHARRAIDQAAALLFAAYAVWEAGRLAIERHLQKAPGLALPGADSEEGMVPAATRLQTILPFLRAAFGIALGVVAALAALSSLGVNTAPLIAGAGVFGLAVSFGSQSLVRDVISGLFFMWDDAFRIGEYIETGRLKGIVEKIGLRSVKVRHHNGPLHTIPYGQLGAVTNVSRDFATIKFNLRLEHGCDIETVRRTAKQIGLAMQQDPEIAAEVILPLKMQGIVEVADTALVVRFKFTARPVKPSWIQREYLKRIYTVFAEKGIAFASGALILQTLPPYETAPGAVPTLRLAPSSPIAMAAHSASD
jgi:small-conductance mechanosensitive channel